MRLGVERGRMPATAEVESLESLLGKWGLMHDSKVLNGAVALFGAQTGSYMQMRLRLARFRGTNKNEFMDSSRADGNFFDLLDAGMAFLFKHLSLSGKIVGFRKEEQLEIPAEALREALTNALCHRQLEKYNLSPGIAVYDDRVEIENPGRFPLGVTPENIKTSHASFPYNPLIAEVLYRSSFLESWGSGVGRMVDACRAQGVPEPVYEEYGGFVKIVFKKKPGLINDQVGSQSSLSEDASGHQVVGKVSLSSHQVVTKLSLSIPVLEGLLAKMVAPMSAKEMREYCGQKDATYFKTNVIDVLITEGLVAMTQPNSPKSPNQKYYLTEEGKSLFESEGRAKQAQGVSEERVKRMITEFAESLPRYEIGLPRMDEQYNESLTVGDARCFQAAYKMKKEMFEDNGQWIYDTPDLYLHEMQVNIWQHYNVQFLMRRADAVYKIRFSEIKAAFKKLGIDGNYAVVTSFFLGTFDSLFGGDTAIEGTDYGYRYGNVDIYKVPSHEAHLIVIRKELLPRCEAKVYEGPSKEYKLINEEHLLYSNIFNMKDEGDGFGLAMMRDIKFYMPDEKDFHYVKLIVDRDERVESELGKIRLL